LPSRAALVSAWLAEHAPAIVGLAEFAELQRTLAPISDSSLRRLLRSSGAALHPLAAGVDQDSFPALRDSLIALASCYELGDAPTRRNARSIVITAKDHAKLAARNSRVDPQKRTRKAEMAAWMLTWLENPTVFPAWVSLRMKTLHPEEISGHL
jgi:hypothetical protein